MLRSEAFAKGKSADVFYGMMLKFLKTCENWTTLSYCPTTDNSRKL